MLFHKKIKVVGQKTARLKAKWAVHAYVLNAFRERGKQNHPRVDSETTLGVTYTTFYLDIPTVRSLRACYRASKSW